MLEILQNAIYGVGTGGYLLIGALGFTLITRVEGFLNIAHASFILVGAYTTWVLNSGLGVEVVSSAVIAVIATALVALGVHVFIYRPIATYGATVILICSVGVTFLIQGLIEVFVGHGTHRFSIPRASPLEFFGVRMSPYHAIVVVVALVTVVIFAFFLGKTKPGRRIRAVSINPDLAASRGISLTQTSRIVWLLSGAAAGLAGVMLGLLGTLTTDSAFDQLLVLIAVSILAGFRSLLALAIAAFATGLVMDLSVLWIPSTYRSTIPFVVIIVGLLLRPNGLLKGERA